MVEQNLPQLPPLCTLCHSRASLLQPGEICRHILPVPHRLALHSGQTGCAGSRLAPSFDPGQIRRTRPNFRCVPHGEFPAGDPPVACGTGAKRLSLCAPQTFRNPEHPFWRSIRNDRDQRKIREHRDNRYSLPIRRTDTNRRSAYCAPDIVFFRNSVARFRSTERPMPRTY